jgi:uncharacterized cofD-like protein
MENRRKKIVAIGGGTGTYTVLSGLKRILFERDLTDYVDLAAVITTADDGGSSGQLRDDRGVLPPGDLFQALIALSDAEEIWRAHLQFRFESGPFDGHRMGNIFLAGLTQQHGGFITAMDAAHRMLSVRGRVVPVTVKPTHLRARLADGTILEGEHAIDDSPIGRSPIRECMLQPTAVANPEAIETIRSSDLIVLGPGDLFTSIIPVLLVKGVTEAICESRAPVAYVVNLMTKRGQTDGYTTKKFRDTVAKYLEPAEIHHVVINTAEPPADLLERYEKEGEHFVDHDLEAYLRYVKTAPLLSGEIVTPVKGDKLRRSLIRHDPRKLAAALLSLIREYAA